MRKTLLTTVLTFMIGYVFTQPSSPLAKLTDKLYDLEDQREENKEKIIALEITIQRLLGKSESSTQEIKQLNKNIQKKTEELFLERSKLSDLRFKYENLLLQIRQLQADNADYAEVIERLEAGKASIEEDLEDANQQITRLTNELEEADYQTELAIAREEAIKERFDEILNLITQVWYIEVEGIGTIGYRMSATHGLLLRGNNLFLGGGVSYMDASADQNPDVNLALLPVYFQIKVPIGNNKLGFSFVEFEKRSLRYLKEIGYLFASADFGYSFALSDDLTSLYSSGGVYGSLSIGGGVNMNENANLYVKLGQTFQTIQEQISNNNSVEVSRRLLTGIHLGVGFNF